MRILLVRHAKAQEREVFAKSGQRDALRPLTDSGRNTARKIGRALKEVLPRIDQLVASPYARAFETAELIAKTYKRLKVQKQPLLEPGTSSAKLLHWLREQPADAIIGLVGHEPDLGEFASYLISDRASSFFLFKKGGACLVRFNDKPDEGSGQLEWFLAPLHLRRLGR